MRYADDLVVFCESREDAEATIGILHAWLAERGLHLAEEKTRIVHLTEGFDFLGFTIRHYPAPTTSRTGYKLLITPSKAAVARAREHLRHQWQLLQGHSVTDVVRRLTPLIRGRANYWRPTVASQVFQHLDGWMFRRQCRYAKRTHPTKSWRWRKARYWGRLHPTRTDHWVFGDPGTGTSLVKFSWFPIERHILVRGTASPDDPALQEHWAQRHRAKARMLRPAHQQLAIRQHHVCPVCGDALCNQEDLQIHHVVPRSQGGGDEAANLELLHLYCHQQRHAPHP